MGSLGGQGRLQLRAVQPVEGDRVHWHRPASPARRHCSMIIVSASAVTLSGTADVRAWTSASIARVAGHSPGPTGSTAAAASASRPPCFASLPNASGRHSFLPRPWAHLAPPRIAGANVAVRKAAVAMCSRMVSTAPAAAVQSSSA